MVLSVVIPALHEAASIAATVASAWQAGADEVLVVDGGSADATAEVARAAGAEVIAAPRGRALQMNAGAAHARGDVLLFLHADTHLPDRAAAAVLAALASPEVLGGCFRLRFDAPGALFRLYAWATQRNWPWLVFGDRALFVRRAAFEQLGGYREVAAFEDVDLARRLAGTGTFRFLDLAVTTSARRFQQDGVLRRQLHNTSLYVRYRLGVSPDRLATEYRYDAPPQDNHHMRRPA